MIISLTVFGFCIYRFYSVSVRFAANMNATDDDYWNEKSFEGFSFEDEVFTYINISFGLTSSIVIDVFGTLCYSLKYTMYTLKLY